MTKAKEVFTVLDFETTGLDHTQEQIIEVAAIKTDLEHELGRFHMTVRLAEGKELPQFSLDTGFTEDMLVNAPNELQAMIGLAAFVGNDTVVAHYAPFDFAYMKKYGLTPQFFLCTRSIERFLNPKESASLAPTTKRYGIELEGAHRAMNDIEATVEVLKAQFAEMERRGVTRKSVQNLIVNSSERPNRFTPDYAKVLELEK